MLTCLKRQVELLQDANNIAMDNFPESALQEGHLVRVVIVLGMDLPAYMCYITSLILTEISMVLVHGAWYDLKKIAW